MNNVISSKDVRVQFSEILNQVIYAGKEFIISRFDKPVAKISPLRPSFNGREINQRKAAAIKILSAQRALRRIDLTEIVIRERDREYRRWKKSS